MHSYIRPVCAGALPAGHDGIRSVQFQSTRRVFHPIGALGVSARGLGLLVPSQCLFHALLGKWSSLGGYCKCAVRCVRRLAPCLRRGSICWLQMACLAPAPPRRCVRVCWPSRTTATLRGRRAVSPISQRQRWGQRVSTDARRRAAPRRAQPPWGAANDRPRQRSGVSVGASTRAVHEQLAQMYIAALG